MAYVLDHTLRNKTVSVTIDLWESAICPSSMHKQVDSICVC